MPRHFELFLVALASASCASSSVVGGRTSPEAPASPPDRDLPIRVLNEALGLSSNAFSSRYVIRHPWEGSIDCARPVRGIGSSAPSPPPTDPAPPPRANPAAPAPPPASGCGGGAASPPFRGGPLWVLALLLALLRASARIPRSVCRRHACLEGRARSRGR